MGSERLRFFHRSNVNGTFDAICMKCFRIVDTQLREVDLSAKEQTHICDLRDVVPLSGPYSWR